MRELTDTELVQALRETAGEVDSGQVRRLLELAARALERRQWVSVKERLPIASGRYLTTDHNGISQCLNYSAKYRAFNAFDDLENNEHIIDVEFWQNITEQPEVGK